MNIIQLFNKFPTQEECIEHIEQKRWYEKPICPYCNSDRTTKRRNSLRYHCNTCNTSYSATVNTIFHNTKLPLQKWFLAIYLVLNAKKSISNRQLARDIEVTKDTACRMQTQIKKAMKDYRDFLDDVIKIEE